MNITTDRQTDRLRLIDWISANRQPMHDLHVPLQNQACLRSVSTATSEPLHLLPHSIAT
jgi:hypothetical protein